MTNAVNLTRESAEYLAAHITYDKGYQAGLQDAADAKRYAPAKINAADFYEHFKIALKYLDLPWGDMDKATISIIDGCFVMASAGKSCTLELPK